MKLPSKNIRIGFLMALSQMLLLSFTIYWLAGQYREEKGRLMSDLNMKYKASYQAVLDTILLKQYIEPVLGDSSLAYYDYSKSPGRIKMSDSFVIRAGSDSVKRITPRGKSIITIDLASEDDSSGSFNISEIKKLEQDMLLRSVRLIVQHADDSNNMHLNMLHTIGQGVDSALFINGFESLLEDENITIGTVWKYDGADSINDFSTEETMIIGGWNPDVPSVSIQGSSTYILGQILPQLLFGFLLILLSGSAFILAFRSLRKQTQLNEIRNSFVSNISHELKTPVSTVKVAIEALRNFDLSEDTKMAREYLDMAAKEIKRLELLITKVLDNAIIEQDSSILRFERVDLREIISGAIDSLTPKIKDANAKVIFDSNESVFMDADPLYLQGVFINLIDNSLKYGNGSALIEIDLEEDNGNVIIKVKDNGPGIPEEYIKKIFEKFFRIPTSDIHNVKGYGLGLSFASLIIEMHNGTVAVANNEQGCTFTINIPTRKI